MKVSDNRVLNLPDQSLGLSNGNPFRMTRVRPELQRSESGCMLMNDHNLKLLCEQEGLYEYP